MKKIAILQSNYIPWKGYFDLINTVDEFIIYDEMQYTKNDWRNRNKIKTAHGMKWLTIPVNTKGKMEQSINKAVASNSGWAKKHWRSLCCAYQKAPFFNEYAGRFEELYAYPPQLLSEINYSFLLVIREIFGIRTTISFSSDYTLIEGKTERLLDLCQQAEATEYISGPAAQCYLDENLFSEKGIKLSWMDYSNYKEYPQLHAPFEHGVSILDLIFSCGPKSHQYMKSFCS